MTIHTLARDSGLAWKMSKLVLEGQGTFTSLDRLRRAMNLQWNWTTNDFGMESAMVLVAKRKPKGLT